MRLQDLDRLSQKLFDVSHLLEVTGENSQCSSLIFTKSIEKNLKLHELQNTYLDGRNNMEDTSEVEIF